MENLLLVWLRLCRAEILTGEGGTITGIISSETVDSICLATADRNQVCVSRDSIEEIHLSNVSIMPNGLDHLSSTDGFGDVLAYLQGLRAALTQ